MWGFLTFLLGLLSLYVLYDLVHIHYYIAVPLSVMVNLVTHYATSRAFVFTDSNRSVESGFVIFFAIGLCEIIFITVTVALLVEFTQGDVYWARVAAGVIAAIAGFLANAKFNFKAL